MTDIAGGGYVHNTYASYTAGSERSAEIVAETLLPLLRPQSVLDVGCGTGSWLEAFREKSNDKLIVHGIDGPWSPARDLLRPGEFTECNFETSDGQKLKLPESRFDLVMSLEFVEHVSEARADILAEFLASKGDALLISAAIPLQGGQHHVNERWPEYWARKLYKFGFIPFDGLRLALWNRPEIDSWYRQNMILYFRNEIPPNIADWGWRLALDALHQPRALVHPEFYAKKHGRLQYAVTNPLGFAQMLVKEAKSKQRVAPPIGNLARE